jgi:hypothetical protein
MTDVPYKYVCRNCGSENVNACATAVWSVQRQEWIVTDWYDGYCNDCEDERRLIEQPLFIEPEGKDTIALVLEAQDARRTD